MISSRTKEALARMKSEGLKLGRPKGRLSKKTKLTGKKEIIKEYLRKKVPYAIIARLLDVHRLTVVGFVKSRRLTVEEVDD